MLEALGVLFLVGLATPVVTVILVVIACIVSVAVENRKDRKGKKND